MRHFGKYTFMTEEERAADYRARVGNLSVQRTVTPDQQESMEEWVEKVKRQHDAI
jgi:hypothetical protein